MKNPQILTGILLGILLANTSAVARETNELITRDKLNAERCKEDFSSCAKISEAAQVAFDVYHRDKTDTSPEETESQWRARLEEQMKELGAGWAKGYSQVKAVNVDKNNAEFVVAEKRVNEGGQYKTYYLIGIRGTQGFDDLKTDGAGVPPEKYADSLDIHGGFKRYTDSIKDNLEYQALVEKIRSSEAIRTQGGETYEVLITGHSLGGASAAILKAHLEDSLPESTKQRISAITFGAPPVGSKEFADKYGDRVTAIVADGDGVQNLGVNAYRVGKIYEFEHPNETEKRAKGETRGLLDKIGDFFNAPAHVGDWHMTYSKRDRYDSSVQNGWDDLRNKLMQNSLSSITQGGASHIGSAAYYLGRSSDNDPKLTEDLMGIQGVRKVEQFSGANIPSRQRIEEYTTPGSTTNLTAPVDIVLNWNQSIAKGQLDLDSHLTGPTSLGTDSSVRFHTRFDDKGSITTAPYVQLYRDVIPGPNASGPEQTRIQVLQDGVYRFYVHDFTNKSVIASPALSQSEANVTVFNFGKDLPREGENLGTPLGGAINVPTDQNGNVWYVFQLDSRTGILKRVNVPFINESDRARVPRIGEAPPTLVR